MEAIILSIIALTGTVATGLVQILGYIRSSKCGCLQCEAHRTPEEIVGEIAHDALSLYGSSD